ncbi:dihydropteroate synthase, partial [Amycolatopsis mediterranei]
MTSHRPEMVFRGRRMPGDRALVMAIVNRTPDSFYDKGATFADTAALEAVDRAVAAGADIVDIGGVKAGEGPEVDVDEESRRVVPFVAEVRRRHPGLVISVDTWRH